MKHERAGEIIAVLCPATADPIGGKITLRCRSVATMPHRALLRAGALTAVQTKHCASLPGVASICTVTLAHGVDINFSIAGENNPAIASRHCRQPPIVEKQIRNRQCFIQRTTKQHGVPGYAIGQRERRRIAGGGPNMKSDRR
jgi:hypothetical protein